MQQYLAMEAIARESILFKIKMTDEGNPISCATYNVDATTRNIHRRLQ